MTVMANIAEAARRKARGKTAVISPIALEAVKRINVLFDIERDINGRTAAERLAVRRELSAPAVAELEMHGAEATAEAIGQSPTHG